MPTEFFAHSLEGQPVDRWQPLETHLQNVGKIASKLADKFGASQWGEIAGLWHDIGKYSDNFQSMLLIANGILEETKYPGSKVDHSTPGAVWAINQLSKPGRVLAYIIAGHHSGLPDWETEDSGRKGLSYRLSIPSIADFLSQMSLPDYLKNSAIMERPADNMDISFWIRMLFSCVVDADYLDTELFMDRKRSEFRAGYPSLSDLLPVFSNYMNDLRERSVESKVNTIRKSVFEQCIKKSMNPSGSFSLTVPTGGGKTLSSLAFALHHAQTHKKSRIIYVIPYTSIIEQTADQFRKIFGKCVIEHHSNVEPVEFDECSDRNKLASENWDAPLIVTTAVQFFESLYAARPSRCRKLHNIVNSVVILDEAQLIPSDFLKPIIFALNELQKCYKVTLVLCTATQPALDSRKTADFSFDGLDNVKEIVDNPEYLYQQLKRVKLSLPENCVSWDNLAKQLQEHESVLCIVNSRKDARELACMMPDDTYHLSALMCGAHRMDKISEIKHRLKDGIPTRVISTQLIEAGVDLDFPVVFRAIAGLDSIAQAAGRCNREGLLEYGDVCLFIPETSPPQGHLRRAAEITRNMITKCVDPDCLMEPEMFEIFFRQLFWLEGERLDKHRILDFLGKKRGASFLFRTASEKFRIIENDQIQVLVKYKNGMEYQDLIHKLPEEALTRSFFRKLQRYLVSIPRLELQSHMQSGQVEESEKIPGLFLQSVDSGYSDKLGFVGERIQGGVSFTDIVI